MRRDGVAWKSSAVDRKHLATAARQQHGERGARAARADNQRVDGVHAEASRQGANSLTCFGATVMTPSHLQAGHGQPGPGEGEHGRAQNDAEPKSTDGRPRRTDSTFATPLPRSQASAKSHAA